MTAMPPMDTLDHEIDAAGARGCPIDLAGAFPFPTHAQKLDGEIPLKQKGRGRDGGLRRHPPAANAPPPIGRDGYLREYQLQVLHRLTLRGYDQDEIAALMGVSVATVIRLRAEMGERMREAGRLSDPLLIKGQTMAFYDAMTQEALKMVETAPDPAARGDAFHLALRAEFDRQSFLAWSGFYRANPASHAREPDETDPGGEAVRVLARFLSYIVEGNTDAVRDMPHRTDADLA